MSVKKPVAAKLHELATGQLGDFFALLAEKSRGSTREGKPYYQCRFRDAGRSATAMIWADGGLFSDCERDWLPGRVYKLRATFGEHEKYGPQLEINRVRPATADDDYDPLEFVERTNRDVDVLFTELTVLVETIIDEPLRQLVTRIIESQSDRLKLAPGSQRHYYPFAGGWLEHTVAVGRACRVLGEQFQARYSHLQPPVNLDLLTAAAVLHDIGRLVEFDDPLSREPGTDGRLLGHIILGRDLVRDAARSVPELNPELLRLLDHLIVTHLTLPEWGSPKLPLIPEALILHHADDLDAKFEMYARCLTRDAGPGPFTDRDPVLNRQLYKGRSV